MPPTLGQRLRHAREQHGWKIEDLAHKTRIQVHRLRELEQDNFNGCGSMTYARSFLKTYAGELQVDASEVLEQIHAPPLGGPRDYRYLTESHGHWVGEDTPAMMPAKSQLTAPRTFGLVAVITFIGMALGVTLWEAHALSNPKTPPPAPAASISGDTNKEEVKRVEEVVKGSNELGEEFTVLGVSFGTVPAIAEEPVRAAIPVQPPPKALPVHE